MYFHTRRVPTSKRILKDLSAVVSCAAAVTSLCPKVTAELPDSLPAIKISNFPPNPVISLRNQSFYYNQAAGGPHWDDVAGSLQEVLSQPSQFV